VSLCWSTAADLSLRIRDIEQMLYFEDLTDVVLVGWIYGGAVVLPGR
jgi:hypothetical protein